MEWLRPEIERINDKLDALSTKLDDHLDRISRTEEAVKWLKGHVNLVTLVSLSVIGFLATKLWLVLFH